MRAHISSIADGIGAIHHLVVEYADIFARTMPGLEKSGGPEGMYMSIWRLTGVVVLIGVGAIIAIAGWLMMR